MNPNMQATNIKQLTVQLKHQLQENLPGFDAQKRMSPSIREHALQKSDPSIAKQSSVLLLFYPKNEQIHLPFIKRTAGNNSHSGQISLPGGKFEDIDSDLIDTAIRETNEELGVNCKKNHILGCLTELYIPVSNFMVLPVLGYCEQRPHFNPNAFEVDELIEVSIREIFAPENLSQFSFTQNSFTIHAPYFRAKKHKIWGATAMILSELRALLSKSGLLGKV